MKENSEPVEECVRTLEGLAFEHEPGMVPEPKPDTPRTQIRQHKRYLVRWRVAIVLGSDKDKQTFYGKVNDISVGGVSLLCEQNIFTGGEVVLFLAMPPLGQGDKQTILKIRSQMIHTVLTGNLFRVGLKFISFKPGEQAMLERRLTDHHHPIRENTSSPHSKLYSTC